MLGCAFGDVGNILIKEPITLNPTYRECDRYGDCWVALIGNVGNILIKEPITLNPTYKRMRSLW
ncbi:MAG: hypothetical protein F6K31_17675 [Symploca sp. SIO2G7]|nr:hypothetical protein [Symploca sp. SIO2G7]